MQLHRIAITLLLAGAAAPSFALGRLVDVTIVDRDTGTQLPVYRHGGDAWVAGRPGARYAVVLRNRLGERVLAVTAVDGVNVLSGETAGWQQSGYVLSPSHRYQVTGWRKSSSEVAAFTFSSLGDSYAARTGRPDHVGVIGVAVFRERHPEPVAVWPRPEPRRAPGDRSRLDGDRSERLAGPAAPSESEARQDRAMADNGSRPAAKAESAHDGAAARGKALAAPPSRLGTAHGQREASWVTHTTFERRYDQPDDIIRIRYDSRENLIASGVIRVPVPPRIDPFPASAQAGYVPDPPPLQY